MVTTQLPEHRQLPAHSDGKPHGDAERDADQDLADLGMVVGQADRDAVAQLRRAATSSKRTPRSAHHISAIARTTMSSMGPTLGMGPA